MEDLEKCEDQLTNHDEKMENKERTRKTRRVMRNKDQERKVHKREKRIDIADTKLMDISVKRN